MASRPSGNLIQAAHQQTTREWWGRRGEYELFVSQLVLRECRAGDPEAAAARLALIADPPLLEQGEEVDRLAKSLLSPGGLPRRAAADAVHIATAALHGIDYLLTWNCKHMANLVLRDRIEAACRDAGVAPPKIGTPDLLIVGGRYDDGR